MQIDDLKMEYVYCAKSRIEAAKQEKEERVQPHKSDRVNRQTRSPFCCSFQAAVKKQLSSKLFCYKSRRKKELIPRLMILTRFKQQNRARAF